MYLNYTQKEQAYLFILEIITNEKTNSIKLDIISKLLRSKIIYGNKYFSSEKLEYILINNSNTLQTKIPTKYQKNNILHILTYSYSNGGHTRIIERWVEHDKNSKIHSILLTEQQKIQINPELHNIIKKQNGNIFSISNIKDIQKKALLLRRIASRYEIIILHIHNYDITPLLAFGTLDFKRPIFFYNHSDHLFWIGASIADLILEIRTYGIKISDMYRGTNKSYLLGIPIGKNIKHLNYNKQAIKHKLSIPLNKKIILSVASSYKFTPTKDINFIKLVEQVININSEILFIIIGADIKKLNWSKTVRKSCNRIITIPKIPHNQLLDYISITDLYIDSAPLGGGVAVIDMIYSNIPILSLKSIIPNFDYLLNSEALCNDLNELLQKTNLILYNKNFRKKHIKETYNLLNQFTNRRLWNSKIKGIYNIAQNMEHNIYSIYSKKYNDANLNNFLCILHKAYLLDIIKIIGIKRFL
ncbi:hypothetical protein MWP18_001334, partial [Campylobacter coli]|nr:glycosyltransferase family 4 protein [Campylobacter coli]EEA8358245.1 glycosyltransferase family 4 protein [Campylobacter coli]EGI9587956.1 glycosyltransferase family 4 protein [Campylobacter coli]EGS8930076.1 glycosyltransferase family 4 protein [Campylobacter coli]EJA2937324.1 hypothetical protein [Campylobacter coli]